MAEHGLIEGITPKLVKFDEDLFIHIIRTRGINDPDLETKVKEALRWNIITVAMFSDMTGIPIPSISRRTNKRVEDGKIVTDLNYTFCWPSLDKKGIKFILRDEKSEKLLRR